MAAAVFDVVIEDLVGVHAAGAVGLHDHALHPPAVREVVDVVRTEICRNRLVDVLEGDAECAGLFAVDHQIDLRRLRQALDIDLLQHRAGIGFRDQAIGRRDQRRIAFLAAVLQAEREARGIAEIVDRRRLQRRNPGVADRRQLAVDVGDDRGRGILRPPLRPVLQRNESLRGVHALAEEAEAGQERHVLDAGAVAEIFFHLLDRSFRAGIGGVRRRLHVGGDEALVVDGEEAAGQPDEGPTQPNQQRRVDQHQAPGALQRSIHRARIAAAAGIQHAVEPAEHTLAGIAVTGFDRLQQRRAQSRRQRQRQQRREGDGGNHGDRELAVDDADRSREERHRHEHRHQHQRDADDGAGDLRHRLAGRFLRRQAFVGHDALDVLDHDDGVVDENADRQHHAEHRQHVDGIAGRHQRRAGAEQRHRHHDGRDDGVADVLQEQEHHDEDQHHRLDQRHQHLVDRGLDDGGDVVGNFVADIGRKEF